MTTPSNANTSGLEVVAWEYRYPDTELWHKTMSKRDADEEREDGSDVRAYAVTAASAQARIAELERWQAAAIRSARIHDENIREFDARATAAEARADRLAKALERIAHPEYGLGFNKLRGIARAAIQQETQP